MERTLTETRLKTMLSAFDLQGAIESVQPYGTGHINDTFYVKNAVATAPDYLLQRINHNVFKNVQAVMENIRYVTTHLRAKLNALPQPGGGREVLTLVPAHDGRYFVQDGDGNYWRTFHFLRDSISHDIVVKPEQAEAGGRAFGQFQALLADLPAELLTETIPDFHNIEKRLVAFRAAMWRDSHQRVATVLPEIQFIEAREHDMGKILRWGREGMLPLRITHNDTKFNNVLLDRHDNARCVIDLDTVMPGFAAYDFGDAIRTLVNTVAEDEKDLEKIEVNLDFFEAFTKGFLHETHGFLTPAEIRSLPCAVLLFPYLMGVRFLTDYLQGDVYYKTAFASHNLQRCRAQFQLLRKLETHYTTLENMVNSIAERYASHRVSVNENTSIL